MEAICNYIRINLYTITNRYNYFIQDENDIEHYIGGNISITTHIINNLMSLKDIIQIIDINEECGIVIFQYLNTNRRGSICEVKNNGIHYWLVNLFNIVG